MKRSITTMFVLLLATAAVAAPEAYVVDKSHSQATFQIRHMMSRVSGSFAEVDGTFNLDKEKPSESNVAFTINAASINTGSADRDKHLRTADFFDTEKFPEITFKSVSIEPAGAKDTYKVVGDLTMHGVTKRVTLPVTYLGSMKDPRGNEKLGFTVETTLSRKDYNINWNRALDAGGFILGEDVKVVVDLELAKKK